MTKACRRCGEPKPLSEYYVHVMMADGHLNICKPCVKARVKTHRRENDSVRDYDRNRFRPPEFNVQVRERQRVRRILFPLKSEAHRMVSHAVKTGRLVRRPCEVCQKAAEAHHDDYTKPLEVRWLCTLHHRRWHAENEAYYPDEASASASKKELV